jgi:hypothetical protein
MPAAEGFLKNRHVCLTACGAAQTLPAACRTGGAGAAQLMLAHEAAVVLTLA